MRAKEKERAKVYSKELDEHSLVNNKHTILNGGQKKCFAWWFKGERGKKGFSKCNEVVFAHTNQKKAQARISSSIQGEERTKEERARKALILKLDSGVSLSFIPI